MPISAKGGERSLPDKESSTFQCPREGGWGTWCESTSFKEETSNLHLDFISLLFMCICVYTTCVQTLMEARRGFGSPGTGGTGSCELPSVGAGTRTCVGTRIREGVLWGEFWVLMRTLEEKRIKFLGSQFLQTWNCSWKSFRAPPRCSR